MRATILSIVNGLVSIAIPSSSLSVFIALDSAYPMINRIRPGRAVLPKSASWRPFMPPGNPTSIKKIDPLVRTENLLGAVGRFDGRVAEFGEDLRHEHANRLLVIDDEHRFSGARVRASVMGIPTAWAHCAQNDIIAHILRELDSANRGYSGYRDHEGQAMPRDVALNDNFFPGFKCYDIDTSGARIRCRVGGAGSPLLLLHGSPQTHVMWRKVGPGMCLAKCRESRRA